MPRCPRRAIRTVAPFCGPDGRARLNGRPSRFPVILPALLSFLLLAACAAPDPAKTIVRVADSGPDRRPVVTAAEALGNRLDNLQPGESVIAGTDLPAAIELANRVEVRFVRSGDPDPLLEPAAPRLVAFKYLLDDTGSPAASLTVDLDDGATAPLDRTLRLMILNVGDAPYAGRLVVHERLDPAFAFAGVRNFTKIEDQRDFKNLLRNIPLVQFYALTLDDFEVQPTGARLEHRTVDNLVSFRTDALTLAPREGVWIDFGITITPTRSNPTSTPGPS